MKSGKSVKSVSPSIADDSMDVVEFELNLKTKDYYDLHRVVLKKNSRSLSIELRNLTNKNLFNILLNDEDSQKITDPLALNCQEFFDLLVSSLRDDEDWAPYSYETEENKFIFKISHNVGPKTFNYALSLTRVL